MTDEQFLRAFGERIRGERAQIVLGERLGGERRLAGVAGG